MLKTFYLFLVPLFLLSQTEINWKLLSDTKFEYSDVRGKGTFSWNVQFSQKVKNIENKEVSIAGYLIPIDYKKNTYALSKYSFANCFYCGGGGMESVIELEFSDKTAKYTVDTFSIVTGIFKLNKDDKKRLAYIITDAIELGI